MPTTPDTPPPAGEPGQFAFGGLDRVLHEKARLGILTSLLARRDGLAFNQLRELCALTDGNLSRHLQTLEEAGLVEIQKCLKGKRPQTVVRLTAGGRQRFVDYLGQLEKIVSEALASHAGAPAPTPNVGGVPA